MSFQTPYNKNKSGGDNDSSTHKEAPPTMGWTSMLFRRTPKPTSSLKNNETIRENGTASPLERPSPSLPPGSFEDTGTTSSSGIGGMQHQQYPHTPLAPHMSSSSYYATSTTASSSKRTKVMIAQPPTTTPSRPTSRAMVPHRALTTDSRNNAHLHSHSQSIIASSPWRRSDLYGNAGASRASEQGRTNPVASVTSTANSVSWRDTSSSTTLSTTLTVAAPASHAHPSSSTTTRTTREYHPNRSFFTSIEQKLPASGNNTIQAKRSNAQKALNDFFLNEKSLQSIMPTSGPHFRKPQVLTYHSRRPIVSNKRMRTNSTDDGNNSILRGANQQFDDNNETYTRRNDNRRHVHYADDEDDDKSSSVTYARKSTSSSWQVANDSKTRTPNSNNKKDYAQDNSDTTNYPPIMDCPIGGPYRFPCASTWEEDMTNVSPLPPHASRPIPFPEDLFAYSMSNLGLWFRDQTGDDDASQTKRKKSRQKDVQASVFNDQTSKSISESNNGKQNDVAIEKPTASSWGNTFASLLGNKWKCPGCNCSVSNDLDQCAACETLRPTTTSLPTTAGWGNTFDNLAKNKWKCPGCNAFVENNLNTCPSCQTLRDTSKTSTTISSTLGLLNAAPTTISTMASSIAPPSTTSASSISIGGFTFGAGSASTAVGGANASSLTTTQSTTGVTGTGGFTFGAPLAPVFGVGPASNLSSTGAPIASFGSSHNSNSSNKNNNQDSRITSHSQSVPEISRARTLYVLRLEKDKYYIGTTSNKERQYEEHRNGKASAWTRAYSLVNVIEEVQVSDQFDDEDKYVRTYMEKFGIDNVRGGSYSNVKLDVQQISNLERELKSTPGRCLYCGDSGHNMELCPRIGSGTRFKDIDLSLCCRGRMSNGDPCLNVNELDSDGYCTFHRNQNPKSMDGSQNSSIGSKPIAGPITPSVEPSFGSSQLANDQGPKPFSFATSLPNGDGAPSASSTGFSSMPSGMVFGAPSSSAGMMTSPTLFTGIPSTVQDTPIEQQGKRMKVPNDISAPKVPFQFGSNQDVNPPAVAPPFNASNAPSFQFGSVPSVATVEPTITPPVPFTFGDAGSSTNDKSTPAFPMPVAPTPSAPTNSSFGPPTGQFSFGSSGKEFSSEPVSTPPAPIAVPALFGASSVPPVFGSTNSQSVPTPGVGFSFGSSSSSSSGLLPPASSGMSFGQPNTSVPTFGNSNGFAFGTTPTPAAPYLGGFTSSMSGENGGGLGQPPVSVAPSFGFGAVTNPPPSNAFGGGPLDHNIGFGGGGGGNFLAASQVPLSTFGAVPGASPGAGFQLGMGSNSASNSSSIARRRVVRAKRPTR